MKKVALLIALVVLISTPLVVQAATMRTVHISPDIAYNGNIATCTARITGNSADEYLEAIIQLWRGNVCVDTWEKTGNGYIFFSEDVAIVQGRRHTLTVDLWVNGVAQERVSVSK